MKRESTMGDGADAKHVIHVTSPVETEGQDVTNNREANKEKETKRENNGADDIGIEKDNKHTNDGKEYQREWYLYLNNITQGPYNLKELLELWKNCIINNMTYVFKSGETNWKYVYNDETLQKYFSENNVNSNFVPAPWVPKNFRETTNDMKTRDIVGKETNGQQLETLGFKTNTLVNENENEDIETEGTENRKEKEKEEETNNSKELSTDDLEKIKKREKKKRYLERKRKKIEEGLSDKKIKNSSVYITGLPKDVTKDEIHNVFKKAGIIKIDAESTEPKIKIYYDENNKIKGDALVTYVYRKSVDIAIKYFDNFYFRQDCIIHVEKAQFNMNSNLNKIRERELTLTKEEKILKKKKIMAAKCEQMRLQKWGDDIYTGSKKKILIFRNVFSYDEAKQYDEGHPFYDSIKNLIETALLKYTSSCKVYPIPKHPKGIVCVKCKHAEEAELLITCFNDKDLNGNKLEVYFYDGKQDLKAQCLTSNKNIYFNTGEVERNDNLVNDHNKKPFNLIDESWQSFDEWVENQSEDEEHKINVEE